MTKGNWWVVCVALAVLASLASEARAQTLERDLHDAFRAMKLGEASVAFQVLDAATEEILAQHNPERALIPASNMKLLTTGCALLILGKDFTFRTEFLIDGDRLWIRGSGDPALFDPELLARLEPRVTVEEVTAALAKQVAASGVTSVREIVLDDRVFDRVRVHPSWPENQLNRWYCAPVGGLNFHANILHVFVKPSETGGTPPVRTQPEAPWIEIRNQARTVATGQNSIWLARERSPDIFTLFGSVRVASREPVDVTIHDPGMFFGRVMERKLRASGVTVADGAVRLAGEGEQPTPRSKVVAAVSTRLEDIVRRCNTDSHNLYAEALLKRLAFEVTGQSGSWGAGGSVLRMTMSEHLGASYVASTQAADGSGMSRENRVSPATLAHWLARLQADPGIGETFVTSLATPGMGTLADRFKESPPLRNEVRAKTGYIQGVRAVSGFVTDPRTGRRVAFSVIMNDIAGDPATGNARRMQEQAVRVIDAWLARQSPVEPAVGG